MCEIDRITESPEYKNIKYTPEGVNTISEKNRDDEVDEGPGMESPDLNNSLDKLHKRKLIVNASGSKKTINSCNKNNKGKNLCLSVLNYYQLLIIIILYSFRTLEE